MQGVKAVLDGEHQILHCMPLSPWSLRSGYPVEEAVARGGNDATPSETYGDDQPDVFYRAFSHDDY